MELLLFYFAFHSLSIFSVSGGVIDSQIDNDAAFTYVKKTGHSLSS
jgi:hypothetical protein